MKKLALLIYPEFSLQEVADLMFLFRWSYQIKTTTFALTKQCVYSEEGIAVLPDKTIDEFRKEDYCCLVLSGCSNFEPLLNEPQLFAFLHTFKIEKDFPIAAICSGPLLLSIAGLLENHRFTNSLFHEMNTHFSFINQDNLVYEPVVVDQNIITATGDSFRLFAIAVAKHVGFECRDDALKGTPSNWQKKDFIHALPKAEQTHFLQTDLPAIERKCAAIRKAINLVNK